MTVRSHPRQQTSTLDCLHVCSSVFILQLTSAWSFPGNVFTELWSSMLYLIFFLSNPNYYNHPGVWKAWQPPFPRELQTEGAEWTAEGLGLCLGRGWFC